MFVFLRILSTEERGVRLCWEYSNPKGPTGVAMREAHRDCLPASGLEVEGLGFGV